MDQHLESWQKAFRLGFAPYISTPALEALLSALENDYPSLIQGATCIPPPLQCVQDWPVEGGCGISYCAAIEAGGLLIAMVSEVEETFARWCFEANSALGEPAGCRHFLNWFDETPREEMLQKLTEEVQYILTQREEARTEA